MNSDRQHHRRLWIRKWSRTLHIYISMLGLLAVVFFSVTGIMLNHEEWFGFAEPRIVKKEGVMSEAMAKPPDKLLIVEKLRKDFSATGAMDSFEMEDDQLRVSFKSPGRHTDATLTRADGRIGSVLGIPRRLRPPGGPLLHRCGAGWRFIIDATAVLLLVTCGTGVMLWCLVPKWRPLGLTAVALCSSRMCSRVLAAGTVRTALPRR